MSETTQPAAASDAAPTPAVRQRSADQTRGGATDAAAEKMRQIDPRLLFTAPEGAAHMARSVVLVRHGRTRYNAVHRIQGRTDIELDDKGLWQVEETGKALRALYVDSQAAKEDGRRQLVVSSPLIRAAQTAHAFADPLGLSVHTDERIEERDFGQWEAWSQTELMEKFPVDFRGWQNGDGSELKHGAEAKPHVYARGVEALNDWAQKADPSTDLFYFSHGSLLAQLIQGVVGSGYPTGFESMASMRNAHWAILQPVFFDQTHYHWRLVDYNHGPQAAADSKKWNGSMTPLGLN
jgi:broad specificity phosphatase PhoE